MQEAWVRSLGREDTLEKEMATHSSVLAWRIPWMEEPGGLQSMGSQRVGHNWATSLSLSCNSIFSFLKIFVLMWTIFKVFREFVTILFLFYVLVFWPLGMWDLSPDQGSNRHPLHWKHRLLTTGPPRKSLNFQFFKEPSYCFPSQLHQFTFPPTMHVYHHFLIY